MVTDAGRLILSSAALLVAVGCSASSQSGARNTSEPPVAHPETTSQARPDAVPVEEQSPPPPFLRIILAEVLVAPVKSDGRPWDMGDTDTREAMMVVDQFASIVASSGAPVAMAVKVATAAMPALSTGKAWPDVQGQARMSPVPTGSGKANIVAHSPDDPMAQLSDPDHQELTWIVQPSKRPRLRVKLVDRDVLNDDAIGVFVINETEMENAWRDGGKYWVRVTQQTNNQVLAAGIIVEEVE